MWISREFHEALMRDSAELRGENRVLREQNKVLQVNLDHARLRNTQLEKERAQLLFQYTGVKIPVPEFLPKVEMPANQVINMDMFNDVGDEQAQMMGLAWDANGRLIDAPHAAAAENA